MYNKSNSKGLCYLVLSRPLYCEMILNLSKLGVESRPSIRQSCILYKDSYIEINAFYFHVS